MTLPSTTEVERALERPPASRSRALKLFGLAAVLSSSACLLAGVAAGGPLSPSRSEVCNPGGTLPAKAALRICAGLTSPKEKLIIEDSPSGVVALHSPFTGYSTTIAVGHKSNAECQHEGAGCVFHHWNWYGSLLEEIDVAGCAANDKTCKVDVKKLPGVTWTIVSVTLDDNNQSNEVAFVVSTQAPPPAETSLSVALSTAAEAGKLAIGNATNVTARVTAQGGSVSSIELGLRAQGSSLSITGQPAGTKGFSLAKGSSRSFTFKAKGVSSGTATLVASATGTSATGKAARASATTKLVVGPIGPTSIDWEMPPRTTKAEIESWGDNLDTGLPAASWVNPDHWTATLYTRTDTGQYDCGSDTRFVWTVKPARLLVDGKQPQVACSSKLNVTEQGMFSVSAQMQMRSGGAWLDVGKPITGMVRIKDWLLIGMGDSNGSGEGDPPFFYERCNRSLSSYQVQTALDLELKDPHTSVTFIFTSCSGARIEHLWHTDYAGTRSYHGSGLPLPPQIDQIKELLADHGSAPERKVDAALISIGVNDLSFGPVLTYCIIHGAKGLAFVQKDPCEKTRVSAIAEPGTINGVADYVDAPNGSSATSQSLGDWVDTKQEALVGHYDDLAKSLPALGVKSNKVLMAQYPDFTHGADGKLCGYDGVARFPTVTWAWLSLQSRVLNDAVHTGAAQHGWIVPEWDKSKFLKAGYCAPYGVALIRNVGDAVRTADIGGPFHPTPAGADVEEAGTITTLCKALYQGDSTCNDPKATKK